MRTRPDPEMGTSLSAHFSFPGTNLGTLTTYLSATTSLITLNLRRLVKNRPASSKWIPPICYNSSSSGGDLRAMYGPLNELFWTLFRRIPPPHIPPIHTYHPPLPRLCAPILLGNQSTSQSQTAAVSFRTRQHQHPPIHPPVATPQPTVIPYLSLLCLLSACLTFFFKPPISPSRTSSYPRKAAGWSIHRSASRRSGQSLLSTKRNRPRSDCPDSRRLVSSHLVCREETVERRRGQVSTAGQAIGPGWRRIGLGLSVCLPGWDNSAYLVAWLQIRLGKFFFLFFSLGGLVFMLVSRLSDRLRGAHHGYRWMAEREGDGLGAGFSRFCFQGLFTDLLDDEFRGSMYSNTSPAAVMD